MVTWFNDIWYGLHQGYLFFFWPDCIFAGPWLCSLDTSPHVAIWQVWRLHLAIRLPGCERIPGNPLPGVWVSRRVRLCGPVPVPVHTPATYPHGFAYPCRSLKLSDVPAPAQPESRVFGLAYARLLEAASSIAQFGRRTNPWWYYVNLRKNFAI